MNAFDLESVHFQSSNGTDLTVGIADKAIWESAGSKNEKGVFFLPNIPTEEVFTAPHKEKVNGIVYGTKPYVFNGQLIKGFHVTFKDGKVVEHGAEEGAEPAGPAPGAPTRVPATLARWRWCLLPAPSTAAARCSTTPCSMRTPPATLPSAPAIPAPPRNGTGLSKEELLARGMNQSSIHEDVMIGAEDSKITGKCRDGRVVELFRNGVWVL